MLVKSPPNHGQQPQLSTLFMVCSVTYTNCKGPKIDAYKSQSVTFANCQYETICQHQ